MDYLGPNNGPYTLNLRLKAMVLFFGEVQALPPLS